MVQENATNAFVETNKIKKQILAEVKAIVKQKILVDEKRKKVNQYLISKGIKFSYNENTIFVKSGGDYSTVYSFNL